MTRLPDSRNSPEVAAVLADLTDDLAFQDDLTGLYNRRLLNVLLRERWEELASASGQLCLVMIDLDFFKEVNDTHGHLVGDRVLQLAADELRRSFREGDLLIRYGGDEFVILLPGAEGLEVEALVERARTALERHVPEDLGDEIEISFSVGMASYPHDATSPDDLLEMADVRLYAEKETRRKLPETPARLLLLAAGAMVLLGLLVAGLLLRSPPPRPQVEALPDAAGISAPALGPEEPLDAAEAEAVRVEVRALEEQVESLRRALDEERARRLAPAGPSDERRELEIATLEATIEELRGRLETAESAPPVIETEEPAEAGTAELAATASRADAPDRRPGPPPPPVARTERTAPVEVVPPRLVEMRPPEYPPIALRSRRESTVLLRVLVGADGRVVEAEPLQGEIGLGFGEAAVRAALQAVYEPATRDGVPVRMEARLRVRFSLD